MILPISIGLLASVAFSEGLLRALAWPAWREQARSIAVRLQAFFAGSSDEERQRLAIASGLGALKLSALALAALLVLCAIVALPPWAAHWGGPQTEEYLMSLTLGSLGWTALRWVARRMLSEASPRR